MTPLRRLIREHRRQALKHFRFKKYVAKCEYKMRTITNNFLIVFIFRSMYLQKQVMRIREHEERTRERESRTREHEEQTRERESRTRELLRRIHNNIKQKIEIFKQLFSRFNSVGNKKELRALIYEFKKNIIL